MVKIFHNNVYIYYLKSGKMLLFFHGFRYRGKIITFQPQITFQAIDFGPTWPCDDVKEPLKELSEELAQGPGMVS